MRGDGAFSARVCRGDAVNRLPALFAALLAVMFSLTSTLTAQTRSVKDGVFTRAQAERGGALYKTTCGHCHRDDLTGGGSEEGAPPLVGPVFIYRWLSEPLGEMFLTIGTTMPKQKPDSLTPQTVADIVSFLLYANDFPTGATELPPDLAALRAIRMAEPR
jgi:quinoprotein glucose dehydrogenase